MQQKINRTGPRPLWLHLNAQAAMLASVSEGEDMFAASSNMLMQAMDGVKAYHAHPTQPFKRNMDIIAECNGTTILSDAQWQNHEKEIVILMPSLINGWHIFDIERQHSFAQYLADTGLCPAILNWCEPGDDEDISFETYILHHLIPLIQAAINKGYKIRGLIGYCMGGTMIAAMLSVRPDLNNKIGKVVLIASPWDFEYQDWGMRTRLQTFTMQSHMLDSLVPTDFVQSLFWAIDPLQVLKKFQKFPNVKNAGRFVRVEDWLNEGRAVSKSVIQTCLIDWYSDNKIAKGQWNIDDQIVHANALPQDSMIVIGIEDKLVPPASILPLVNQLKTKNIVRVDTGHIGLMASDKSIEKAWKPIAEFLN
jgi:polyhydroxyalkanoate synthase